MEPISLLKDKVDFYIIDQHAAQERVIWVLSWKIEEVDSSLQQLWFPILLNFQVQITLALQELKSLLNQVVYSFRAYGITPSLPVNILSDEGILNLQSMRCDMLLLTKREVSVTPPCRVTIMMSCKRSTKATMLDDYFSVTFLVCLHSVKTSTIALTDVLYLQSLQKSRYGKCSVEFKKIIPVYVT